MHRLRRSVNTIILCASLSFLVACNGSLFRPPATATPTATLTPLPPTRTPLPTNTATPTSTSTPTPTLTPTPRLLALPSTPLPPSLQPINREDAANISGLASFQESTVSSLAWLPDGHRLAVAHLTGVSIYDPLSRTRLAGADAGQGVISLAFSPDGAWMTTGQRLGSDQAGFAGAVQVWSTNNWQRYYTYNDERAVSGVAYVPNSDLLAASFTSQEYWVNTVSFWNTTTWEMTGTMTTGTALALVFSPDGKYLATAPDRYGMKIWNVSLMKLQSNISTSFTGAINSLAFSPDGALLASGHYDGMIRLWNPTDGKLIREIDTQGVVNSLAFSPDSKLLASGHSYQDTSVRLWATDTGELLRTLDGHTHAVEYLAFAPAGNLLASGSYDGSVYLWGLRP